MKTKTLILAFLFLVSCQQKEKSKEFIELNKKYDSISELNYDYQTSSFYRFNEIYKKERESLIDTVLLPQYKSILGNDEVVNLYVWDRINTISQKKEKKEILKSYLGSHILKSRYSNNDRYVTSVEINNDSCFLYKNKKLIASNKIKLVYSRNELTPGTFSISQYLVKLIQPNIILLRDKNCLHCSSLEFYKVN